jgi:hypothetical protein
MSGLSDLEERGKMRAALYEHFVRGAVFQTLRR